MNHQTSQKCANNILESNFFTKTQQVELDSLKANFGHHVGTLTDILVSTWLVDTKPWHAGPLPLIQPHHHKSQSNLTNVHINHLLPITQVQDKMMNQIALLHYNYTHSSLKMTNPTCYRCSMERERLSCVRDLSTALSDPFSSFSAWDFPSASFPLFSCGRR